MTDVFWANADLLDRLLISADGQDVGVVDDLELSDTDPPELVALLSGPIAFGPRLGGRMGVWWLSVARRLHADRDPTVVRLPLLLVKEVRRSGIVLRRNAEAVGTRQMRTWVLRNVVSRIPGHQ